MNEDNPLKAIINAARLEEGVVEFVEVIEGRTIIYVRCDNRNIHPENLELSALTQCIPLNFFGGEMKIKPKAGTKCLIIFKNPGNDRKDFSTAYYFGSFDKRQDSQPINSEIETPEDGMNFKTEQGFGIGVTNGKATLFSEKSSVIIQNDYASLNHKKSSITIGNAGFQAESFDAKGNSFGILNISNRGLFARAKGEIVLAAEAGDLRVIANGANIKTTGTIEMNAREISMTATTKFVQMMGSKVETISGNILNPVSFSPAYQIKVITGGYGLSVAQGDLEITMANPLVYNSMTLRNGLSFGPLVSLIELNATDIVIKNRATALISKMTLGLGMLDLASQLTMSMKSTAIDINGDAMITIKTPMFILNVGTVIPDPTKPVLNTLGFCVFSGMVHSGNKALGA